MRKIKEVLRLRYELKLDQRQIARSCSISVSTVHEYLKRTEGAKVSTTRIAHRIETRGDSMRKNRAKTGAWSCIRFPVRITLLFSSGLPGASLRFDRRSAPLCRSLSARGSTTRNPE
jgi:hypothetical protein